MVALCVARAVLIPYLSFLVKFSVLSRIADDSILSERVIQYKRGVPRKCQCSISLILRCVSSICSFCCHVKG